MNAREVTPKIVVADQPTESELAPLKDQGFAAVVNLRHEGEPEQPLGPAAEGERVREAGLAYLSVPVGGAPLSPEGVDTVTRFIDEQSQRGKVLVHCRKGGRAAALALLHQARTQGWPADQAIEKGRAMGLVLDDKLRALVENYLAASNG